MPIDDDTLLAIIAICLKRKGNEKKKKKRIWVKKLSHEKRNEFTYQDLLDELKLTPRKDFRHFFMYDASIYEELLKMIGPLIKKKDTLMRIAIPVGLRLSTTLRFLATGYHFQNMKFASEMSPVTISKIVQETCEAIISQLKDYLKPPESPEAWMVVANDFKAKCSFPNCLGAVNGKHIAIIKPTGTNSLYYNYRKFFSVVLMAVVNANYEFLVADVDICGSTSGNEDFCYTTIGKTLNITNPMWFHKSKKELPYVFIGDDGFQFTKKFMKKFSGDNLPKNKQAYNHHLSRVHQIAENTFGALCSQFGVLQKPMNLAPDKVKTVVLACCYLYNFLRRKAAPDLWDEIFDKENLENGNIIEGSWREYPGLLSLQAPDMRLVSHKAVAVREKFANYFSIETNTS